MRSRTPYTRVLGLQKKEQWFYWKLLLVACIICLLLVVLLGVLCYGVRFMQSEYESNRGLTLSGSQKHYHTRFLTAKGSTIIFFNLWITSADNVFRVPALSLCGQINSRRLIRRLCWLHPHSQSKLCVPCHNGAAVIIGARMSPKDVLKLPEPHERNCKDVAGGLLQGIL